MISLRCDEYLFLKPNAENQLTQTRVLLQCLSENDEPRAGTVIRFDISKKKKKKKKKGKNSS